MTIRFKGAGATDRGQKRPINEDYFYVDERLGLLLVADGLGKHAAGDVAAKLAVEHIAASIHEYAQHANVPPSADVGWAWLHHAIRTAHDRVIESASQRSEWTGMGTTIVAVLACKDRVLIANVGDSRAYRLRGPIITRLTLDHTFAAALAAKGRHDAIQPAMHHMLTQAIGSQTNPMEVYVQVDVATDGDLYLLCSDGLHGMLVDKEIASALIMEPDLQRAAARLIDAANARGGFDNITAVVARVGTPPEGNG